ncbi:hypothetical protein MMC13_002469 [Lambiella insularis]|nr:hypothetical protein [Lambiella insularis]
MASQEQQSKPLPERQPDAKAQELVKILQALNSWIDSREEERADLPSNLPPLCAIHKELASKFSGPPVKYRRVEVVLYELRKHERKEFSFSPMDQKNMPLPALALYRYGTVALQEDVLASLKAQTGKELHPTSRWSDIAVVLGHFRSTASLKNPKSPSQRASQRNRTKLGKRVPSTTEPGTSRKSTHNCTPDGHDRENREAEHPRAALPPCQSETFKEPTSPSPEHFPQMKDNAADPDQTPSLLLDQSFKRQRLLHNAASPQEITTSMLPLPLLQNTELQANQEAWNQYIAFGDKPHGLLNGEIKSSMDNILSNCNDTVNNYLENLGLSYKAPVPLYFSRNTERLTELGSMLFEHSDRSSWSQSALKSSSRGISNGHFLRGFLQAFIFKEILQAPYPSFLHLNEPAIDELHDRLKHNALYGFYQYIRCRAFKISLNSPFNEEYAKEVAIRLAIRFHQTLQQMSLQDLVQNPLLQVTPKNPYCKWSISWEKELEDIFLECLNLRAQTSLDLHKREVVFSLPLSGQDFNCNEMTLEEEEAERSGSDLQRTTRKVQVALGPLVVAQPVDFRGCSRGENIVVQPALAAISHWTPKGAYNLLFEARRFATSAFPIINSQQKIEEETLPSYDAADFYPVNVGEVFNSRYQVLGKLGYGSNSTAWLARDLQSHRYNALKVYRRGNAQKTHVRREIEILERVSAGKTSHEGQRYVRTIQDSFELQRLDHTHQCLVHKPLWISLFDLQKIFPGKKYGERPLRAALAFLLEALDYLHTECSVVHTGRVIPPSSRIELSLSVELEVLIVSLDIKADNILQEIEDLSILEDFEKAELEDPSPRKIDGDRVIYKTRKFRYPKVFGNPVLCDFGYARYGNVDNDDDIQPAIYRAPEVILTINWSYSVDIWNVGVMIWDLFEKEHMFNGIDPADKEYSERFHLAEMIAYLGPPPPEFVKRSRFYSEYFDEDGKWDSAIEIPNLSLEDSEANLHRQNKKLFLEFVRKMLRWVPEERQTARELLEDPWLNKWTEDVETSTNTDASAAL